MHLRHTLLRIALLATVAGCASAGRQGAAAHGRSADPAATAPPTFPSSVADFVQRNREQFDDPALGVVVGYATPQGLRADVFLYPAGASAGDTSLTARRAAAHAEAADVAASLRILAERGRYSDLGVAAPAAIEITGPSGRPLAGTYLAASMRQQGQPVLSDTYVFVLADKFLKIRATYPAGAGDSARAEVRTLVAGLAIALDDGRVGR